MAGQTTPEKVKTLLSSFLATSKQQYKSKRSLVNPHENGSPNKDDAVVKSPKAKGTTSSLRSFENFLERLDTFTPITWFCKPVELSPLICARYGWANVDTDNLQCVSCKAHLCGKLPDCTDGKAYQVFKEKLKKDILAAHDKFCVLAANPCPEHFCQVACDDPSRLISDFSLRLESFSSVPHSHLPPLDFSTLSSYSYDEGQVAAYCKRNLLPDLDTTPEIVCLAVTGWSYMSSKSDILICTKCRRQVGLWNYGCTDSNSSGEQEITDSTDGDHQEPEVKIQKTVAKSSFNPVEEHKHWCPWVVPSSSISSSTTSPSTSQNVGRKRAREEDTTLPALMVALKVMAPGLMDNNTGLAQAMKVSPVADGLRCFRRVVKAWSSKKSPSVTTPTKTSL